MSKKATVILARSHSGPFHRTLRDPNADPVGGMRPALKDETGVDRVLVFNPGEPKELTAEELEAVRDDIGTVLRISKIDSDEKPVAKPDDEATAKFVEETKKMRAEEQATRNEERKAEAARQQAARDALTAPLVAKTAPRAVHAPAHKGDIEKK